MLLLSVLFNNRLISNFPEVFVQKGGLFDEFLTTFKFFPYPKYKAIVIIFYTFFFLPLFFSFSLHNNKRRVIDFYWPLLFSWFCFIFSVKTNVSINARMGVPLIFYFIKIRSSKQYSYSSANLFFSRNAARLLKLWPIVIKYLLYSYALRTTSCKYYK